MVTCCRGHLPPQLLLSTAARAARGDSCPVMAVRPGRCQMQAWFKVEDLHGILYQDLPSTSGQAHREYGSDLDP